MILFMFVFFVLSGKFFTAARRSHQNSPLIRNNFFTPISAEIALLPLHRRRHLPRGKAADVARLVASDKDSDEQSRGDHV